jgi:hypothetical protein
MYPGVVFPTGWIVDGPGTVQMYNGAADTPPLAAAVLGLLRALVPRWTRSVRCPLSHPADRVANTEIGGCEKAKVVLATLMMLRVLGRHYSSEMGCSCQAVFSRSCKVIFGGSVSAVPQPKERV